MTIKQTIKEIQNKFDIKPILAYGVFFLAEKKDTVGDYVMIIDEKPKPFVNSLIP